MSTTVPTDHKCIKHDLSRRYRAFQISFRDAENDFCELTHNKNHEVKHTILDAATVILSNSSLLSKMQASNTQVGWANAIIKVYKQRDNSYDEAVIQTQHIQP